VAKRCSAASRSNSAKAKSFSYAGTTGQVKTTLLNILSGNLEPDAGVIEFAVNSHAEHITFPRPWWRELNPLDHFTPERVAKEGVGRTWQDIRLFPTLDLQNNIAVALPRQIGENPAWAVLRRTAVKRQEQENLSHAHYLLSEVGLEERDISSADRISLGQSKRVAIARAVHAGAKVLFLDEPFAGLDNEGISQILQLIDSINSQHKVTVVIVEHVFHIPLLLTHATTVWTLARGEIRVDPPATVQKNFTQSQHDAIED
jgi:ABC-type branched-subunit amino acid transport system ATPase component